MDPLCRVHRRLFTRGLEGVYLTEGRTDSLEVSTIQKLVPRTVALRLGVDSGTVLIFESKIRLVSVSVSA